MLDNKACAFTGHRDIDQSEYEKLATAIYGVVGQLYQEGFRTFYCGGALGFDTVAAVTLLNIKQLYPDLRLVVAQPCPEQSERWTPSSKALYDRILQRADEVVTIAPAYTKGCMLERNRYMVDRSELLVAYVKRESGGSAYTLRYAKKKGVRVINLGETL